MKATFLAAIFVSVSLFSCTKKTEAPGSVPSITTGTWHISLYWDKADETSNFSPYIFMFNSDGSFMAHTSTTLVTGTWSESSTKLTIHFESDPVLSKINGSWLKTEKTSTSIKLKDDNPAQDDQLVFVKN